MRPGLGEAAQRVIRSLRVLRLLPLCVSVVALCFEWGSELQRSELFFQWIVRRLLSTLSSIVGLMIKSLGPLHESH